MLFRKSQVFIWEGPQIRAMEILKLALTTAPALKTIDYSEGAGMIICAVDASGEGWGGNLMQVERNGKRRHAIRYESGIWSDVEKRYDAGKRECRGVLKMLKKCRGYLYGVHFVLELDANTLVAQLNRSANDLPGALVTSWIAWIQLFDFTVKHVPGNRHTAADGLSRRPKVEGEDEDEEDIDDFIDSQLNCVRISVSELEEQEDGILETGYSLEHRQIAYYLSMLQKPADVSQSDFKNFRKKALQYLVQDGHLFRRQGRNVPLRRVVDPPDERNQIIQSLHDESGHRGKNGTFTKVSQRYWWENLYRDIKDYVKTCSECQRRASDKRAEELHPTWVSALWEKVAIDAVHMPQNQGKKYIIIARDDLSGWPEAKAIPSLHSKHVARFIYEDLICRHGCFRKMVSDGGKENKKKTRKILLKYLIKHVVVSAYNPQANGMIERGHQPIIDALSKMTEGFTKKGEDGWVTHLPSVLFADRTTIRVSTGMTPFRMIYGYEAILPIELDVPTWQTLPWNTVRTRADLIAMRARQIERRDQDIEEAIAHLRRMRLQGKEYFDRTKNIVQETPKKDDLVLLYDTKKEKSHSTSKKLKYRWSGPYRIREVILEKGSYFLEELDGTPKKNPVHGNRLKKFWLRDPRFDIPEDDERDGDVDMPDVRDNNQHLIPERETFAVII